MFQKKEKLKKSFLSLVLITSLILNPVIARTSLAQTVEPDPTVTVEPTPTTDVIDPTPLPDPLASPTPTPDIVPDIVASPEPSPTPDPILEPTPSPTPDPALGDTASSLSDSSLNPGPSPTPEVSPDPGQSVASENNDSNSNNNQTEVNNNVDSNAQTGTNNLSNGAEALLDTGQALAQANLLTLLNTTIVGANFQLFFLDQLTGDVSQIDLNTLWNALLLQSVSNNPTVIDDLTLSTLLFLIKNSNNTVLNNNVNVAAGSGNNQANGNGNVDMQTGDATALANVINFVNTNITGTQFLLTVINLLGEQNGDIILPRPEKFTQDPGTQDLTQGVISNNQNQGSVISNVDSQAITGENQQLNNTGNNTLLSGDATARNNIFTLIGFDVVNNNWFFLIINNLGNWSGEILGWLTPDSAQQPILGSQVFQTGADISQSSNLGENSNTMQNTSSVEVNNNIQTQAVTGQNQANGNGNTSIQTGNAISLANLVNLINLNILGGNWFFGLINILGNWTGNIIFAYPELAVSISGDQERVTPGTTVNYNIAFMNIGHDDASSADIHLTLPEGLSFLGDTSGQTPEISGQNIAWHFGNLGVGQSQGFTVTAQVSPDFKPGEEVSWFSKLVPKAYAAEDGPETSLVVNTQISTPDPQSDTGGNSASVTTVVYTPMNNSLNQNQPNLEISGWENVGDYVHPGDTITFEITVKNNGEGPANNTILRQGLFNEEGTRVGSADINLGTIAGGRGLRISFGLALSDQQTFTAGNYYTVTQVEAEADNGNHVSSNQLKNDFLIALKDLFLPGSVQAAGKEEEVLGAQAPVNPPQNDNIMWYFILFLLSTGYVLLRTRATLGLEEIKNETENF